MYYNLVYMDNLAFSSCSKEEILQAYDSWKNILYDYKINLQQYATNCPDLSKRLESTDYATNFFVIQWHRDKDSYFVKSQCSIRKQRLKG